MFNKNILVATISGVIWVNGASAVELYKDEVNSFSIGGHLSAGLAGSDEGDTEVNSVSPRINFAAKRDLGNGFSADAKAEWSVNFLGGGENAVSTRLGYLGLSHDSFGRLVAGTQWSPFYSVAGIADQPIAFASDTLYTDHGNIGSARANKMLSYSNMLELGEAGQLKFGLGWQGEHDDYEQRGQGALSYHLLGFSLGYTYSSGDKANVKTSSSSVAAKYGKYGKGLFVAGVFTLNDNINEAAKESDVTEAIVAYALENSLNFSVNYEALEVDPYKVSSELAFQVEYHFISNVVGYAGYQVDLGSDDTSYIEDDQWMFGGRIYL